MPTLTKMLLNSFVNALATKGASAAGKTVGGNVATNSIPFFDVLESRLQPTGAFLSGNVLTVVGGYGADVLDVQQTSKAIFVFDHRANDRVQITDFVGGRMLSEVAVAKIKTIVVNLSDGADTLHLDVSGKVVNKSVVVFGGEGDDSIFGGNGRNTLYGEAGDDSLVGGGADDKIYGGVDGDTILGGAGNDFLYGEQGFDLLYGEGGNDNISGGDQDDVVDGGDNNDFITGGNGNDWLGGGSGNDVIDGGSGDDILAGKDGADLLIGGYGTDWLYGDDGDDVLISGLVNSSVNLSSVRTVWTSNQSYAAKVNKIVKDYLKPQATVTMDDSSLANATPDKLYGQQGRDLVFWERGSDWVDGLSGDIVYNVNPWT